MYTAEGFVTKNSDTLPHNLREVVQRSANSFIQEYFVMGSDAVAALHRLIHIEINGICCRRRLLLLLLLTLLLMLLLFLLFFFFHLLLIILLPLLPLESVTT